MNLPRNPGRQPVESPVFIVGGSRTGSEMLKTMLSASPDLDFVDEMYLMCPRWLHKDVRTVLKQHIGNLPSRDAADKVVDLLFSGVPFGWTWSHANRVLDRESFSRELRKQPVTLKSILTTAMRVHAEMRGKSRFGAKFPVHYSYADHLLRWYPYCKILHTTRDPRAVYASQSAKHLAGEKRWFMRSLLKVQQFVHINVQTAWTAEIHDKFKGLPNYRLIRYEDIVSEPEAIIRDVCKFLEIDFEYGMLQPKKYGSSFVGFNQGYGVDSSSLDTWQSRISPMSANAISILQMRARRLLGYID